MTVSRGTWSGRFERASVKISTLRTSSLLKMAGKRENVHVRNRLPAPNLQNLRFKIYWVWSCRWFRRTKRWSSWLASTRNHPQNRGRASRALHRPSHRRALANPVTKSPHTDTFKIEISPFTIQYSGCNKRLGHAQCNKLQYYTEFQNQHTIKFKSNDATFVI